MNVINREGGIEMKCRYCNRECEENDVDISNGNDGDCCHVCMWGEELE